MGLRLTPVLGNAQRLDGGAMFGNAPKALWSRWIAPDAENRIPLACRCLLVEEPSGRRILFEAGIGAFFAPELRARYGVESGEHALLQNLAALGIAPRDVDVVVLSHLHFDHAGGVLSAFAAGRSPELVFERARYVVGAAAWERACAPHARDRASFIPGLTPLLESTGRVERVEGRASRVLGPDYRFHLSEGHTPGLLLGEIPADGGPVLFASDAVPGRPWVHLPITMGYDRFPERLIDEKRELLGALAEAGGRVCFTHDPEHAFARVEVDAAKQSFRAAPVS